MIGASGFEPRQGKSEEGEQALNRRIITGE